MVMRTYGLSGSGMDVDQMVKDLMKARRASYDQVWQKKTQTEWKKKDFNTIYTLAEEFRNKTIFDFKKQNTLSPKQVTSTNDAVVSVTANGDAANVSHSVIVDRLADGVKLSSSAAITASGKTKDSLRTQFDGYVAEEKFDLMINGKTITVEADKSINDLVSKINSSGADVKANYDATLDRFYLYSTKTGAAVNMSFAGSSEKGLDLVMNKLKLGTDLSNVTVAGMESRVNLSTSGGATATSYPFNLNITKGATTTPITIDAIDTLGDIAAKINGAVGENVAAYDAVTGKFSLKAVSDEFSITGADSVGTDFLYNRLQLGHVGVDAQVKLDGVSLAQGSNTFTISGVTYNLKSVSFADTNGDPIATTVTIKPDIDKAIANVKAFVDSYNTFISAVNSEINENRYRDFMPLTDAQKADMKESDIKAWEEKAKSGMLRRDPLLTDMTSKMRMNFTDSIKGLSGKYQSASDIGIGTGSYVDDTGKFNSESSNGGKIYVKEDTLRKALEEDPDAVFKIFGSSGDTAASDGIANRLYDQMYDSLKKIKTEAGYPNITDTTSNLAKRLKDFNDRLYNMDRQLASIEQRYYKQFDAMEAALSKMNQQSGWLMQQFSG